MAAAERGIKGGRFAAACGVLSSYVKKAAAAAEAWPAAAVALPLMPGADVSVQEEHEAGLAPTSGAAHAQSQMTIFYGGRVLVLDEFPAYRAAELLRLAAEGAAPAQGAGRRGELADDLSMARKASLQRFMEKRKGRLAARGVPYRRPDGDACSDHLTLAL